MHVYDGDAVVASPVRDLQEGQHPWAAAPVCGHWPRGLLSVGSPAPRNFAS